MFGHPRAIVVFSIVGFASAAISLWCGLVQPLTALDASVKAGKPAAYFPAATNPTVSTSSNLPSPAVKNVPRPQPPISCKVAGEGVLFDCRVNDGYNLNDVANWFQDEHARTLEVAVNSVTLAKKYERSLESCQDESKKK